VVRIATGSATVATITGSGIVAMPEGGMDMVWTGMILT
jgi:H+/gluconate symporter-like permease